MRCLQLTRYLRAKTSHPCHCFRARYSAGNVTLHLQLRREKSAQIIGALHRASSPVVLHPLVAMFSPEASAHSARSSLRNPRRRQRKDSDGLQQQPRRKRSKLSKDSLHATNDAHLNGNGNGFVAVNGHADHGVDGSLVVVDMPVREKQEPPKRVLKDDTSLYLVRSSRQT